MTIKNHWGIWIDSEKPITGVYSNNDIAWEGVNDEHCLTCEEWINDIESNTELDDDSKQDELDLIECYPDHEKIIGDWIINDKGLYEPDTINGEFAAIVRESTTQVVYSKFTAKHGLCSPCYPGQADVDSTGEFLCYILPEYLIRQD